MGSRRVWRIAFLLATPWALGGYVEAGIAGERPDSLFQVALKQAGRVPVQESLEAFKKVLKEEWNYAPAHHEMAKLYLSLKTLRGRTSAEFAVKEALSLDPENVAYRLTLGEVLRAQGFLSNAGEQYEEALKANPGNVKAAYGAGCYYLEEFMICQDAISGGGIPLKPFAVKYRDRAISYLERCIRLDPGFRDAYSQLGVVYVETRQPDRFRGVANRLLKRYPGDKDALLFGGLACQNVGALEKAYGFYTEALKRMDPKERGMIESVDLLQSKEKRSQFLQVPPQVPGEGPTRAWYDRPETDRFWKEQDPLFLTEFNERRMEHYGRVAYANLRFGDALRGKAGWQTDMGKAWIKHGRYVHRASGYSPTGPFENWSYEGFSVGFVGDGTGNWVFSGGGLREGDQQVGPEAPPLPSLRGGGVMEFDISKYFRSIRNMPRPRHVFIPPSRYVDPYRDRKYSLPHQVAAFRDKDSIRVELSFAIPTRKLSGSEGGQVTLESGVFAFDGDWKEVYRRRAGAVRLNLPSFAGARATAADSLRRNSVVCLSRMSLKPGEHHLVAEVRDPGMGSIGTFREQRIFSFSDTALAVSDLLLASRIESRTPTPERRQDLDVTPNPLRTFSRSEPVSVYFEVYNLKQDTVGLTEYEVSYRVGRPRKKEVDPGLFAALDLPETRGRMEVEVVTQEVGQGIAGPEAVTEYRVRYVLPERHQVSREVERVDRSPKGTETVVTARYGGDRKDDFAYLQIDVGQMPAGVYKLTVAVKDTRTGQTVARETLFRVVG